VPPQVFLELPDETLLPDRFQKWFAARGWSPREHQLDLLRKAHAAMSPGGHRSDAASEWRSFNILYYRYFRYNLATEHTRVRVDISNRRDFFRDQRKAIELLCTKVCEMETAALHDDQAQGPDLP